LLIHDKIDAITFNIAEGYKLAGPSTTSKSQRRFHFSNKPWRYGTHFLLALVGIGLTIFFFLTTPAAGETIASAFKSAFNWLEDGLDNGKGGPIALVISVSALFLGIIGFLAKRWWATKTVNIVPMTAAKQVEDPDPIAKLVNHYNQKLDQNAIISVIEANCRTHCLDQHNKYVQALYQKALNAGDYQVLSKILNNCANNFTGNPDIAANIYASDLQPILSIKQTNRPKLCLQGINKEKYKYALGCAGVLPGQRPEGEPLPERQERKKAPQLYTSKLPTPVIKSFDDLVKLYDRIDVNAIHRYLEKFDPKSNQEELPKLYEKALEKSHISILTTILTSVVDQYKSISSEEEISQLIDASKFEHLLNMKAPSGTTLKDICPETGAMSYQSILRMAGIQPPQLEAHESSTATIIHPAPP
jgi:hypothetical protein